MRLPLCYDYWAVCHVFEIVNCTCNFMTTRPKEDCYAVNSTRTSRAAPECGVGEQGVASGEGVVAGVDNAVVAHGCTARVKVSAMLASIRSCSTPRSARVYSSQSPSVSMV